MTSLKRTNTFFLILVLSILTLSAARLQASRLQESSRMRSQQEALLRDWEQRKARIRAEDIKIENYAKGLSIVKLERRDDSFIALLRNDYPKTITRYTIAIAEEITGAEMLNGNDENLRRPGDLWEQRFAIQMDIDTLGLKVLAVIFDDRSTDGDPEYVKKIRRWRLGMKMQRERALELVTSALAVKDDRQRSIVIRDLESQLSPLSQEEIERLPSEVRSGILGERNRILRQIARMRDINEAGIAMAVSDPSASRSKRAQLDAELATILRQYEATIPRL